mmetsp:Transcript_729/g.1144  ORF Transcript_729/g.1144 Transcript_729/m.1144 type:complete len:101 (-) Transcript_729:129-431(-)
MRAFSMLLATAAGGCTDDAAMNFQAELTQACAGSDCSGINGYADCANGRLEGHVCADRLRATVEAEVQQAKADCAAVGESSAGQALNVGLGLVAVITAVK